MSNTKLSIPQNDKKSKKHDMRFEFVKRNSVLNPVKNLVYIRCYNSNSPLPIESPKSYTILKIRKKGHISTGDQEAEKRLKWSRFLETDLSPNIPKHSDHSLETFQQSGNTY